MNIVKLGETVVPYSVDGTKIYVHGDEIDCTALDSDSEVIYSVKDGDSFVADVIIPPRRYDYDSEGQQNPVPLNMDRVTLRLWPNFREVA